MQELRKRLKRSYYLIQKSLSMREVSEWLTDNFYIIDKHYRVLKSDKGSLSQTDIFYLIKQYCIERDCNASPETLSAFLRESGKDLSYFELCAVKPLLAACAIDILAESLSRARGEYLIPHAIKLLQGLDNPEYDDILQSLWAPEEILLRYERDYIRFDRETKADYRARLAKYAKRFGLNETDAAKKLAEKAKSESKHIGSYLFAPSKSGSFLWLFTVAVSFALLFSISWYFISWLSLILIIPFCITASEIADNIVSRRLPAYRAPRLELERLPDDSKTLVAVAALLNESSERVFESLSKFAYANPDENIFFCLLADLPDCDSPYRTDDKAVTESARRQIDALNEKHGNRFCLFLRERVLNESESRYGGWERKRGAVCELARYIENGKGDSYYGGEFIREIKYILTLDSDTNLALSGVNELLSVALHPLNTPIIENGKVVDGYGIIQPSVKTSLKSAYKTAFSRLISGAGGQDSYANAEFSRSQTLFGSGGFCGKGLINVEVFNSTVNGILPEGLVLSHDILEGAIMRTLAATDISFTDSTPANTVSFFRRQHRWMRGDFQNLYFLFGNILSPFSKARVLAIALRHLAPLCSLIAIGVAAFSRQSNGLALLLLAYSDLFIPCVISLLGFFANRKPFASLRFFSKAYSMLVHTLIRVAFELSSRARSAFLALNAFILALTRLYTRKKTLQWTTAAQAERLSSSLGKFVLDSAASSALGLLLLVLAIPPFIKLLGLLYFVYPLISISLSKSLDGGNVARPSLNEKQKKALLLQASDMLKFYLENVNSETNYLPPDNIQLSPVYDFAYRTSPTNIGFYLASMLAARDINEIDTDTLVSRLDCSIQTLKKLEKHRGNLYNWYDIKSLAVIGGRYISLVDSGNFIVMLVALKEGLKEYLHENCEISRLIADIEELISKTDLTCLYDSRKNLFRIGMNTETARLDNGCYDMLMSEARMTAYYAIASGGVPKKHWRSLNRTLTHKKGYIGMLSWSGTAFEYLMPQLFLPLYKDSFLYESVAFSLMIQKSQGEIWGISESGFYSFDSEMHYQYKANGIQQLALRRIAANERVISPYSTYLSLCLLGNSAIKNLKALENRGLYGRYGLFEALDMNGESGGICVKSYMAHHIGMSIIAVLNAVRENIFVKRFTSDEKMASALELLQEKIPTNAHIFNEEYGTQTEAKRKAQPRTKRIGSSDPEIPAAALLSRGNISAVIASNGHIALSCGEKRLAHTEFSQFSLRFTPKIIFERNGNAFGCAPLYSEGAYGFEQGEYSASHIASNRAFSGRVRYSISKQCDCFIINTRAESNRKYNITLAFEPMLESEKKFLSHIAFSRLFIESEYDKAKRILYFHRRSGLDGRHIFTLAVAPRDKEQKISFATTRENIKACSLIGNFDYAFVKTDNSFGACIDPLCLMRAENADGGRAVFLITCGETKGECERNIRLARADRDEYPIPPQSAFFERLLPALLYGTGAIPVKSLSHTSVNDLWSKGISGDYPIIAVAISSIAINRTDIMLDCFYSLAHACIRTELIFIVDENDSYSRLIESVLRERCAEKRLTQYIGANGGIFILRKSELSEEFCIALKRAARFYCDFSAQAKPFKRKRPMPEQIVATPIIKTILQKPQDAYSSNRGFFTENGFTVDKSNLPDAPYSFVLTGYRFSTVITQSSLGYTFFDNARERRLCSFYGDSRTLDDGERIFAKINGKCYDLCAVSQSVSYQKGKAVYFGYADDIGYTLTVCVDPKFPIKLIKVEYEGDMNIETEFCVTPVMSNSVRPQSNTEFIQFSASGNGCIIFKSLFGASFPEGHGFIGGVGASADEAETKITRIGKSALFFIGCCTTENGAKSVAARVSEPFFESALANASSFADSFIPKLTPNTKSRAQNIMLSFFLPYQVAACRFLARGSFYQSGGAYGFRDQLQDCLTLVYSSPRLVGRHIIRCCAHQYLDGSVMHWWHTRLQNGVNSGIKSKCSDDLLYLPLVIADYIEKTGDIGLLDTQIYYLDSPPLESENERYETPIRSEVKESVYLHAMRALSRAERIGRRGLILIGSCDWNDGFSLVGAKGIGESVFSTMLFIVAASAFLPYIEARGDTEAASHYRESIARLRSNLESNAFYTDRYARAFCDDGRVLGVEGSAECEIDIISQAFAVFAGLDKSRCKTALKAAFDKLYDRESKIFKLFSPPFTNGKARVGYIRGYVAGIRENGGMYTHGALWGALAMIMCGMHEEALLILDCANPASRSADKRLAAIYKNEPYAISADIYGAFHSGRGGWSWYTGAAAWYYRIMLEFVLGLKLGANQTLLSATPIIPYTASLELGNSVLEVTAAREVASPLLDGKAARLPLSIPDGRHILSLPLTEQADL